MVFKKDINKILLYLIAVHVVLFTGFSIYYEASLRELSLESNMSKSKINDMVDSMVAEQLNETLKMREAAQFDRQTFEQKYYSVLQDNENLIKEIGKLNEQGCR